ncbi:glutathione synthetase ATP-binding domain-like protein [Amniculicola lignicola CBS 123094]|uniref:Glutathione synthetase ATP-binding domain-like protein n=1 Tax=Amniculicola lignicola CBS 123094 TaxID=1392246 RepID=A0A6A5W367_9PLEO|nr:glutathione synthetase ATP-binding domain-like protein [Amniculicola lignicola CBS 123094]
MEMEQNSCILEANGRYVRCHYSHRTYNINAGQQSGRALNIVLAPLPDSAIVGREILPVEAGDDPNDRAERNPATEATTIRRFLAECIKLSFTRMAPVAITLVLPSRNGFMARTDVVQRRFEGCTLVEEAVTFLGFSQPCRVLSTSDFLDVADSAHSGLRLRSVTPDYDIQVLFQHLESELENRLSLEVILSKKISHKRLLWVEGRSNIHVCRRILEAAKALGIKLVIIDNPGHWLQDDQGPYSHFREAFLPMNIAVDDGFVPRLVETVRNYTQHTPVDGMMTISDARLPGVAKACETFGLPTSPSSAYIFAGDKYQTRALEQDSAKSFRVYGVDDLKENLEKQKREASMLKYPLIVKPCFGWGSECVAKVFSEEELVSAVNKASARHAKSPQRRSDVIIEPYVDGPEVDANFALLDGQVVFYEVADDFPSLGDAENSSAQDNFQETANLLPTGLPTEEVEVVRNFILKSILRMGFKHGIFHCEGRLRNSTMRYTRSADVDGSWDLSPDACHDPKKGQSFFLHEINARPAGYLESVATALTYGVDYYALQLLFSVGDMDRYRMLAQPFLEGPQWHLELLLIPEDRAGTMNTPDATLDLMHRHPNLKAAIIDYNTVIKAGDQCRGPSASELSYLAYISVVSRAGRADCLRLSEKVRREFIYELVEDE